jgi:hypothetical protein
MTSPMVRISILVFCCVSSLGLSASSSILPLVGKHFPSQEVEPPPHPLNARGFFGFTAGPLAPVEPLLGSSNQASIVNSSFNFSEDTSAWASEVAIRKLLLPDAEGLEFESLKGGPLTLGMATIGGFSPYTMSFAGESFSSSGLPNLSVASVSPALFGEKISIQFGGMLWTQVIPFPQPVLEISSTTTELLLNLFSGEPATAWQLESTSNLSDSSSWTSVGPPVVIDQAGEAFFPSIAIPVPPLFWRATYVDP